MLLGVDAHVGVARLLVRVVDAGEPLDLAPEGLLVQTLDVASRTLLDRGRHEDLHERSPLLDELTRLLPRLFVRRDCCCDDRRAVPCQARGNPADPLDVRITVILREPETFREMRADCVAVEILDDRAALFDRRTDEVRDRRLAGAREPREPERESAFAATLRLGMLVGIDVVSHSTP